MSLANHTFQTLHVDITGAIATIRLNRPEARNALSHALMRELTDAAQALRHDTAIQAVILTGTDSSFSAGADLADGARAADQTLLERRETMRAGPALCAAWEALEQITIAAIEGYCVGGGVALALACDFRVLGVGASLRLPEVPLGMNMSWHSLPRLVALMGPARAKRFTIFGEALDTELALAWGLADDTAPTGQALAQARQWAERIAALPPLPVRMSKEAINAAANALHHTATFMDRDQWLLTAQSEDFREGIRAFFEKRDPRFTGN